MYTSTNPAIRTLQIYAHIIAVSDVDRDFFALRSLRLCGGIHNRTVQPSLHVNMDLLHYVWREVECVSDTVSFKAPYLGNDTAVLAIAVRPALASTFSHRDRANVDGGTKHNTELGMRLIIRISCNTQPHCCRQTTAGSPVAGVRPLKTSKAPPLTTNALSATKQRHGRRAKTRTY